MTDHELNRDRRLARRSHRPATFAAIAALSLGSLALAGCGNGEEEMPPMEEPAGEESSTMGQETDMGQDPSMDSEDPALQQEQTMDEQEPDLDQQASSDEAPSAMEQNDGSMEQDDDQGDDEEAPWDEVGDDSENE